MGWESIRQAIYELSRAANSEAVFEILLSYPFLTQVGIDQGISLELELDHSFEEFCELIAVRAFLTDLRKSGLAFALEHAGSLPLAQFSPIAFLRNHGSELDPDALLQKSTAALHQLRQQTEPAWYACAQYFQAYAIFKTIAGDRNNNLRKAARIADQAVKSLRDKEGMFDQWRACYDLLADVWEEYAELDLAKNADTVIHWIETAIEEENGRLKDAPYEHAILLHTLGYLYYKRPGNQPYADVEKGIVLLNWSVEIIRGIDWKQYALSLMDLGNALIMRIAGERVENLQQALNKFAEARKIHCQQRNPARIAEINYNTAIVYRALAYETVNEKSADAYTEAGIVFATAALQHYTCREFPRMWAKVQSELGTLYYHRHQDRADSLEKAIEHFSSALEAISISEQPVLYANIQNNLANALCDRVIGSKVENHKKAVQHYQQALRVFTPSDYPQTWANVRNNLGTVFHTFRQFDLARSLYSEALFIRKKLNLYADIRQTAYNLGNMEFQEGVWDKADQAYQDALEAGDKLYKASLTIEGKKAEQSKHFVLTQNAVYAIMHLRKPDANRAFYTMEKNKTRILSERLREPGHKPEEVCESDWQAYQIAAEKVRNFKRNSYQSGQRSTQVEEETGNYQQSIEELNAVIQKIRVYDEDFLSLQELTNDEIRSVLPDDQTALVAFCVTEKGGLALILDPLTDQIHTVMLPHFTLSWLNNWLFGEESHHSEQRPGGWLHACDLMAKKDDDEKQADLMEKLLEEAGQQLVEPVLNKLNNSIRNLIILPTSGLFLLPFHAVPLPERGGCLIDHYCVSYTPSIKVLRSSQARLSTPDTHKLFAVIGPQPSPNDPNNSLELSWVMKAAIDQLKSSNCPRSWDQVEIVEGLGCKKQVVLNGMRGYSTVHFYGHGNFNQEDPLQSGLELTGGETLTLRDLQGEKNELASVQLLTLTACETGIPETKELPEEYLSLPSGFMQAGIPCIISALWKVPEESSALLMDFFYQHYTCGASPQTALRAAQQEIRSIPYRDLLKLPMFSNNKNIQQIPFLQTLHMAYETMAEIEPEGMPFSHPYYWAAFTVNGAASG